MNVYNIGQKAQIIIHNKVDNKMILQIIFFEMENKTLNEKESKCTTIVANGTRENPAPSFSSIRFSVCFLSAKHLTSTVIPTPHSTKSWDIVRKLQSHIIKRFFQI